MANGFWRIGRDNTEEKTVQGKTAYLLKMPTITKENLDLVNTKWNLPKTIIIDTGIWKDTDGSNIEIGMPIISTGIGDDPFTIVFPTTSILNSYQVVIGPANAEYTEFAIVFDTK